MKFRTLAVLGWILLSAAVTPVHAQQIRVLKIGHQFPGGTLEEVKAILMGSPEYLALAGGTDNAFLTAVYHDGLNRPADPLGLAHFQALLAAGVSRTEVALQILTSHEAESMVVNAFYQQTLARPGDLGGVNFFAGNLEHNTLRDEAVLAALLASDEFFRQF